MTEKNYFIVKYKECGAECPIHLSGKLNHPRLEWDTFETNPNNVVIEKEYEFTVTDRQIKSLDFDLYGASCKTSGTDENCLAAQAKRWEWAPISGMI
ncbi:hypothetical protein [Massilia genomosp. 1]|uniref:Uncharacterized protein n=1 Tax=Massilia genomosp. 1 TaxID=2609280 RepID=A0ABX0MWI8_9BURK|nr:hypothetical protein [Massilia genomosp. 1]NHZ67124.1 hypothetical protein [Massilia genomosp. 1]